MTEDIEGVATTTAAAPQCTGSLGWVYYNGYCYMFTSYHVDYLKAEELCNQEGAYLADVKDGEENNFIKGVLNVINPKDGTDYWLGGLDADGDKGLQWMTGMLHIFVNIFFRDFHGSTILINIIYPSFIGLALTFTDFVEGEPGGRPYLHMNFDSQFKWDTKDDANDKDNGFVCKKVHTA